MPEDTWYSVVVNNPTDQDEAALKEARSKGWLIEGQMEKGKNGTPHYQLALRTDEGWTAIKQLLPRANIQEAEDPVALRRYVVKEATRVLDLTPVPTKKKPQRTYNSADFYNDVFNEAHEQFNADTDELVKNDDTLKVYDLAVNQLILQNGYDIAIRATRPDVRSAYRKYRYAMWSVWYNDNIGSEHRQDADDDTSEQQEPEGSVGEEHDDTEAEAEGSGEELDDDTEGSSEATDYEE
jgi:hypothetical protein